MGTKMSKLQLLQGQCGGYQRLRLKGTSEPHDPLLPPRGYVPVYVGRDDGRRRKYFVHTRIFKRSEFSDLLRRSVEEYGFGNESGIRVVHEADEFEKLVMEMTPKQVKLFRAREAFIVSRVA